MVCRGFNSVLELPDPGRKKVFLTAKHGEEFHPKDPSFTSENKTLWVYLMNGVFHLLCHHLGAENFSSLLEFVKEKHLYPDLPSSGTMEQHFTEVELSCLIMFEEVNGLSKSERFSISPPDSIAALTHWRILSNILHIITPAAQQDVYNLNSPLYISGIKFAGFSEHDSPKIELAKFADSHFHLDLLLKRSHHSNFRNLEIEVSNHQYEFGLGIANYVFPDHWKDAEKQIDNVYRIRSTFGIHPHLVKNNRSRIGELEKLLQKKHLCRPWRSWTGLYHQL